MARLPETKQVARALRDHARHSVHANGHRLYRGRVADTNPFAVELLRHGLQIEQDHLVLGTWARHYDRMWGIAVGDLLLMAKLDDESWYVQDVLSQSDTDPPVDFGFHSYGGTGFPVAAGGGGNANANIIGWAPYYDKTGAFVGVIPVLQPV